MIKPKTKAGLYTLEKVLYLASRDVGINVYHSEKSNTTLRGIITKALSHGWIKKVAEDDASVYYRTTKFGDAEHLRFKIEYAVSKGKDASELLKRYQEITSDTVG